MISVWIRSRKKGERLETHILDLPPQILNVRHKLHLLLHSNVQIESCLVRRDKLQVGRDGKDVPQRPRLEEIERDIRVRLQQRAERDEALLDCLQSIPLRILLLSLGVLLAFALLAFRLARACVGLGRRREARGCPALHEGFHCLQTLYDGVRGAADDVVEQHLWGEPEEFGDEGWMHGWLWYRD